MIPMILIAGSVDVFYHFIQCPLHPEWSAPCEVNWIFAIMYGFFLVIVIILAIISTKKLKKIKEKNKSEFLGATVTNDITIEQKNKTKKKSNWNNAKKLAETKNAIKNVLKSKRIIVNSESALNGKFTAKKNAKNSTAVKETSTRKKV